MQCLAWYIDVWYIVLFYWLVFLNMKQKGDFTCCHMAYFPYLHSYIYQNESLNIHMKGHFVYIFINIVYLATN